MGAAESGASPVSTARRHVIALLRLAVSLGALGLLLRQVDLAALPSLLAEGGAGPLLIALAAYVGSQVVSALRWMLVARSAGFDLTPGLAVRYYFIGMFFNVLAPSTLGGDIARTLYLGRERGSRVAAAATVLFDRAVGLVWLATIAAVALALAGVDSVPRRVGWAAFLSAGVLVFGACAVIVRARRGGRAQAVLGRVMGPMQRLFGDGTLLARASALSLIVHASQIGAAAVLAAALTPQVHWSYCLIFQPLVAMLGALPVSVAGLGVRESGYVYFLTTLRHVPVERATAFALAWLAVVLVSALMGAVIFLVSGEGLPSRIARQRAHSPGNQRPSSS